MEENQNQNLRLSNKEKKFNTNLLLLYEIM